MKKVLARVTPLAVMALPFMAHAQWKVAQVKTDSGLPGGTIKDIVVNMMKWLLVILGAAAIIGFVVSGIIYLTSAGDEERIERAKRGMIYSIIGVIVGLVGYVIVNAVTTWLGGASNTTF